MSLSPHRYAAGTKRARQGVALNNRIGVDVLTKTPDETREEIEAHNKAVDKAKQDKLRAKLDRATAERNKARG